MHEKENGSPQVMLGDWNTGPEGLDVEAEFQDNYDLILLAGWENGNVEHGGAFCTWCPHNDLFVADGTPKSAIDHIFVKHANVYNVERVFDA